MNKSLVAYFSASGVTKNKAVQLAEILNTDIFEIKPLIPYSSNDLDWTNKSSRSSIEMDNPLSRPQIEDKFIDMDDYENIFIGFPIWWYVCPRIINTFLESYDFTNKNIILFATSGGSTISQSVRYLKESYPKLNFINGKLLNSISKQEVNDWLKNINK